MLLVTLRIQIRQCFITCSLYDLFYLAAVCRLVTNFTLKGHLFSVLMLLVLTPYSCMLSEYAYMICDGNGHGLTCSYNYGCVVQIAKL